MVVGRIDGHEKAVGVATPAEALAQMLDWLRTDANAAFVWYLREDWPEPVTLIGRPASGVVGETRRSAHLFHVRPGVALHGSITARCGTELSLTDIEWLRLGAGMPCECCLVTGARHELGRMGR
ncbi:hypothetical protein FG385_23540 [Amycolatopsis alkalitolerans]|uniref:Uncharacterized protein n=2 Tax=Amycolatopsis alkalitolerans TaxID=2547244 RepID=A0A5C4LXG4_9PSEU|nr:hypothetical protein FG385_23540 [Amycolatopsis alkalitolerans]